MTRLLMYGASLLLFVVALMVENLALEGFQRFYDLWYFALFAICIEFTYRLRNSWLLFLPVYKGLYFLYRFLEMPGQWILTYSDSVIHILTGVFFISFFKRLKSLDSSTAWLLLATGAIWLLLGLRAPLYQVFGPELEVILQLHLPFYLLAAILGKILVSPFNRSFLSDEEFEFVGFSLFFTLVIVVRVSVENFVNDWIHLIT